MKSEKSSRRARLSVSRRFCIFNLASLHVCDNRDEEVVMSAEMPLVKEVTTTLREWGSIWKQLFVVI